MRYRNICAALISISIIIMTSGCSIPGTVKVPIKGNATVGIRKGQVLQLSLEANATTGYIWEVSDTVRGIPLKQLGKYRYVHKSKLIGAGGNQLFRFEGVKRGSTNLLFEYKRPWEKDAKPAKRYSVRVLVN